MAQTRHASIAQEFERRTRRSRELHERALKVFPSGVTHDNRLASPYPIHIERAAGSRKWDVDGNEYVDFGGGHGALLLGHAHPAITTAVVAQAPRGSHYGAAHPLEVRWAELVQQIVPSAERVKFFSSGTEATMMAMRLARAFTGKEKIVKFQGHFHGWHDYATVGMQQPYDEPVSIGIPKGVAQSVVAVPHMDGDALERALSEDDVAAVILLQNGLNTDFLTRVRELTRRRGVVLIFDEVITGFRYAPGGAQEYFGVTPDLTTMAKILAGGYPGGAIGGRADILDLFHAELEDERYMRFKRIPHPGTFNGNPISAAAGIACLEIVRDPAVQKKATATADRFRAVANEVLRRRGVGGKLGGEVSIMSLSIEGAKRPQRQLNYLGKTALQIGGVDTLGFFGSWMVSAVHTEADVDRFGTAFDQAVELLQQDGAV